MAEEWSTYMEFTERYKNSLLYLQKFDLIEQFRTELLEYFRLLQQSQNQVKTKWLDTCSTQTASHFVFIVTIFVFIMSVGKTLALYCVLYYISFWKENT